MLGQMEMLQMKWSFTPLENIQKDNDVDRNLTEGSFKACDHSE